MAGTTSNEATRARSAGSASTTFAGPYFPLTGRIATDRISAAGTDGNTRNLTGSLLSSCS